MCLTAMSLTYRFSRHKSPQGYSYPFKRSQFDIALTASGVTSLDSVVLYFARASGCAMRVEYTGEQFDAILRPGTFAIWIYAVPSAIRAKTLGLIMSSILPSAFRWMLELQRAGNVRRDGYHDWSARIVDGEPVIEHD
jgi:hypothetical protein